MIDSAAACVALRERAMSLVAVTTGSTTLSATTTGYARAAGSFVTDGFVLGMELTPSGFATNTVDVITGVTAFTITTANARTAEGSASSRSLTVGLPALRAWENQDFTPTEGRPFLEEDFVHGTSRSISLPVTTGTVEETGLYVLKWYGLANTGILAIRKSIDALKALFTPGTTIAVGSDVVRVRADVGPFTSQLLPHGDGWTCCVLTIPWRSRTTNAVSA